MRAAILLLAVLVLSVGCSKPQEPRPENALDRQGKLVPSGFLKDYSKLAPSRQKDGAFVYFDYSKKLSLYKMVMLDPVEVRLHPSAKASDLDPAKLQQLAQHFENAIRQELGYSYPVVQEPGFGVIRMRVAITDVEPAKPGLAMLPFTNMMEIALGGATVEGEFLDAQSGQQVVAFVDYDQGVARRKSNAWGEYGQAEDRLTAWAVLIKDRLDEARGLYASSDIQPSRRFERR